MVNGSDAAAPVVNRNGAVAVPGTSAAVNVCPHQQLSRKQAALGSVSTHWLSLVGLQHCQATVWLWPGYRKTVDRKTAMPPTL